MVKTLLTNVKIINYITTLYVFETTDQEFYFLM
eukprot:SAG31_NODE_9752_length_1233_cov_1.587302_2_plen_33_part_00